MQKIVVSFMLIGLISVTFSCSHSTKTNSKNILTDASIASKDEVTTLKNDPKNYVKDQNGCFVWNPNAQPNDKANWSGGCKNGYANGNGTLKLSSKQATETYNNTTLIHGKIEGKVIVEVSYKEKPCETCIVQFTGTYKNGNPIEGALTFGNGKTKKLPFVKDKNGCLVWALNTTNNIQIDWSGACKDGFANGKGTLKIFSPKGTENYNNITLKNGIMNGYGFVKLIYKDKPCETCIIQFEGIYKNSSPINGTFLLANKQEIKISYVEAQNGCLVWNPEPKPNEKVQWTGKCVNGFASGKGILTYSNNKTTETLQGTFKNGMMQGKGTVHIDYTKKCDTCIVNYTGVFKDHKPIQGNITFANGMIRKHKLKTTANSSLAEEVVINEIVRRTVNSSHEYYTYGNLSSGISSPLH